MACSTRTWKATIYKCGFEDIMYGNEINSLFNCVVVQYLLLFNVIYMLSPENSLSLFFWIHKYYRHYFLHCINSSSLGEHLTTTCTFGRPCIIWAPLVRVSVDTIHQLLAITPSTCWQASWSALSQHAGWLSDDMSANHSADTQLQVIIIYMYGYQIHVYTASVKGWQNIPALCVVLVYKVIIELIRTDM